jgi:hypothetical protein
MRLRAMRKTCCAAALLVSSSSIPQLMRRKQVRCYARHKSTCLINAETVEVDFGAGNFSGLATNRDLGRGRDIKLLRRSLF